MEKPELENWRWEKQRWKTSVGKPLMEKLELKKKRNGVGKP